MRILITGGAGFIGSALVRELLERAHFFGKTGYGEYLAKLAGEASGQFP